MLSQTGERRRQKGGHGLRSRWRRIAAVYWLGTRVLDERTLRLCFWNAFWGKHTWVLFKLCQILESFEGAAARIGATIAGKFDLDERQVHGIATSEVRATLQDLSRRFAEKCLAFKEAEPPES
jgi:hypothetical protein